MTEDKIVLTCAVLAVFIALVAGVVIHARHDNSPIINWSDTK